MTEDQMALKTAIVIPNYNGIAYIADCLMSIREDTTVPDRIIVVDNGSTDGSDEVVRRDFPEVELIALSENTGFCGGVNAGIDAARREGMDYVILLNNDTRILPGFTRGLIDAVTASRDIFSCQAMMLSMSDPELIDDAGDLYCALGWAFARGKGQRRGGFEKRCDIFSSCAGAAIYSMKILDEIGTFDERHFAYLEDTDIGWRAKIAGYRNVYAPEARVLHVGSASSGSIYNLFKVRNSSRNSIYLIGKNMPLLQILINLPLLIPGFAVKAVFFAMRGYGGEYIRGIGRGFSFAAAAGREGRKVPFRFKNLGNYMRIQLELWVNTVRRIGRR